MTNHETSDATNMQQRNLLALSMQVIQRNRCNKHGNLNATSMTNKKSCLVSHPKEGNQATRNLHILIHRISQHFGGDDEQFLFEYINDVIEKWSDDLDTALACFKSLSQNLK